MTTREEIEAAAKRYAERDYPKRCRETISQWDEYWQPIQLADDQEMLANAYITELQQRERDQQRPTRKMFERLCEQSDCFDLCKDVNSDGWYFDGWYLDLDTIAKLRAACLLLGIDTERIL